MPAHWPDAPEPCPHCGDTPVRVATYKGAGYECQTCGALWMVEAERSGDGKEPGRETLHAARVNPWFPKPPSRDA